MTERPEARASGPARTARATHTGPPGPAPAGPGRPGRPRSEAVRRAILEAALAELDRKGYAALTVEGIAATAGAGKQTIYRWWPSKAEVVLDALLGPPGPGGSVPAGAAQAVAAGAGAHARPMPAAGVPEPAEPEAFPAGLAAFLGGAVRGRGQREGLAGLLAQALLDPGFADVFRERFLLPRQAALAGLLERAAARGEIAGEADRDLLAELLHGLLWHRLLLGRPPLDAPAGRRLAALLGAASG
ncbi:TetR/AcrR family transcriptional regulator [Streptomyces sp. DSM 44917]|uniref:TetR/AcrR family transcriptional regulator n=1 Tax=Streptomyces boetiae TaxID=3075541 RepID=A0ABU2LCS8_9ACTN|nr:TetR/AcrR family transcriptional regulator [Streptomyces sp. DSM 44917]MDT0309315.1 TetR/AcrR family transcriptional regulator [Streptomyces sp. DSM 44917]